MASDPESLKAATQAAEQAIAALGPLRRRAARILIASAQPMLPDFPDLAAEQRAVVDAELEVYLQRQVFSMPRYLLLPYLLALLAFDLAPLVQYSNSFRHLRAEQRESIVASWSGSRIAQKRDLLKLIRNCALYYYLDHPLVRARLEAGDGGSDVG